MEFVAIDNDTGDLYVLTLNHATTIKLDWSKGGTNIEFIYKFKTKKDIQILGEL